VKTTKWPRPFFIPQTEEKYCYLDNARKILEYKMISAMYKCCCLYHAFYTSISVFLTVGPKCMLAASHAAPWWVMVSMPMGPTDRQMPDSYITLSTTDAANVITAASLFQQWETATENVV